MDSANSAQTNTQHPLAIHVAKGTAIVSLSLPLCVCRLIVIMICRDHLPGHSYTYKSPAKREAAAAAVDLSNATFTALEDQIEGLNEIKVWEAHNSTRSTFSNMLWHLQHIRQ